MSNIIKEIKLINSDVDSNKNKYWNATLLSDGTIEVEYGRVGYSGQTETYDSSRGGEYFLDKKVKEKIKKGYQELKVIGSSTSISSVKNSDLKKIVSKKIGDDSELTKLMDLLVKSNIHNITSSTNISYNKDSNLFSTPLGIITIDSINEARQILNTFNKKIEINNVNQYLRLVPQSFGMKKFDVDVFKDSDYVKKQFDILDSLEASWNSSKVQDPIKSDESDDLLNIKLEILKDQIEYERIVDKFEKTKKRQHTSSYHLKVKKIYSLEIKKMKNAFDSRKVTKSNVMELWHGSNVANILSIFNSGLKIRPSNASGITGRLFGNGIYGASDSTKSLNYSVGYWSGTKQNNVFLFVADFDMENYEIPEYNQQVPRKGYDSFWAKPNKSGILNDEYIVFKEDRVNLKYLIECE